MNERDALLLLTHIPFLGSIKIRLLIQHFGSALNAIKCKVSDIAELPGFGPKILSGWLSASTKKAYETTKELIEKFCVQTIFYNEPSYPKRLLDVVDFPLVLYVRGTLLSSDQDSLAVVGTRRCTIYGYEMTKQISGELSRAKFTIVSGLARGIDTAAHEAASENGRTIAVLGSGLANIYPRENIILAENIVENGAIISEFPMATPPDRLHFPQRNRIVSGMTRGTILMEAPKASGAMITVQQALNLGRPVFTIPGRIDEESFEGNHYLLKNRQAELIENSKHVIIYYNDLFVSPSPKLSEKIVPALESEEEVFFRALPQQELSIEEIVMKTKLPITRINVLLMSLVLKKMVKEYPGKIYKKV